MTTTARRISMVLALSSALVAAGCGGGGGSKGNASTAAGATGALALPEARAQHTAVMLSNGEVFVAGGLDVTGTPMSSTVLIGTSAVRQGPALSTPRVGHTVTVLSSGELLIAGGQSDAQGAQVLDTTEVFDPLTGTISAGPTLAEPRTRHAAITVNGANGQVVLFAGGLAAINTQTSSPTYLASAEVLDAVAGASTLLASGLTQAQADAHAARLDSGGVLIVGGLSATGPAAANVFDAQTQTFSAVASVVARSDAAVASIGREVLVAGGASNIGLEASTEVFDDATSTFAQGVALSEARSGASAVEIAPGQIALAGGRVTSGASDSVEVLEIQANGSLGQATVRQAVAMAQARYEHAAVSLGGGKALVIGGYDVNGVPLASIETLDPNVAPAATPSTPTATPTTTPTTSPGGMPAGSNTGSTASGVTPGNTGSTTPNTGSNTGSSAGSGGLSGLLGSLLGGGSSGSSTGGLSGLLGSLLGGSNSGGSGSSSILNMLLQSAVQALTANGGTGNGFSGFFSSFAQNLLQNLLGSNSGSSGGGGIGSLLSGLLGSLTGGSSGNTGGAGGVGGLLSGLLGGLFGGNSGSTSGSTGSGSTAGGSTTTPPGLAIAALNPNSGRVGDSVTISGTGFGSTVGVTFNGVPAPISSAQRNSAGVVTIACTVPQGATTGQVVVSSGGQTASAGVFTVQ